MTKLIYAGPDPEVVGVVPLPEGWPARDHEEGDAELAAAKLASGMYALTPGADSAERAGKRSTKE